MKKLIDHHLCSSVKEFLQYKAWTDLDAARTVSGQFYEYDDPELPDYHVYSSSYSPWAYDNTITGLYTVPTGFGGYTRPDIHIDFQNGRIISTGALPNLTGTYEFPLNEISFFVSSQSDWQLLDEGNFLSQPYMDQPTGAIPPNSYVVPAVFVKSQNTTNEPMCLGGMDWTVWNYRITAITKDEYELTAIQKIVRDCKGGIMTILPETPFDPYGDLKFGAWDYHSFCDRVYYAFIEDSSFKILESDIFVQNHPGLFMGIGNIEVRVPRFPRVAGSDPDLNISLALTDISDIFDTDDESDFVLS